MAFQGVHSYCFLRSVQSCGVWRTLPDFACLTLRVCGALMNVTAARHRVLRGQPAGVSPSHLSAAGFSGLPRAMTTSWVPGPGSASMRLSSFLNPQVLFSLSSRSCFSFMPNFPLHWVTNLYHSSCWWNSPKPALSYWHERSRSLNLRLSLCPQF